ncbi:NAD(P)-binding protein [Rhizopogon vinicolor AM-OR11-026]|uniref:enoyl-[acyl-carrier-protein] reductase n=1 Tax=Rhizopogon vinicolor AM-OR11-026 TaxID=1314800 RepID=A0A1B7N767_9AGAM|nr:NAD(P)-binding protein [Rhizopogon vinicolor AM-OR11-026]
MRLQNITPSNTFSTSSVPSGNRAIVYNSNGDPARVLSAVSFPELSSPPPDTLNIRLLLAPINPADINVIEGIYPAKPHPDVSLSQSKDLLVFVGGNEGLGEVMEIGDGVAGLQKGDWVVLTKAQTGTWSSAKNVASSDVLKVPRQGLSEVQAATITVNPPTAYNMLHDFAQLAEGDWMIQNGANSAVGQAVIQIAAAKGYKTINFIRDREDVESLKSHLELLGATHVVTYDELFDKSFRAKVKTWTGGKDIRLGLNCVSGKTTTLMARLLGDSAHLVSYGAMSKEPLSLPTSLFIFKNLTCHGFWQTRWYSEKSLEERQELFDTLTALMRDGKLRDPGHEILTIGRMESDDSASERIRELVAQLGRGMYGKKVLLRIEETA